MKKMQFLNILISALCILSASCAKPARPLFNPYDLPDDVEDEVIPIDPEAYKGRGQAPMCWSIYEYAYQKEQDNVGGIDYSREQWQETIDWVADNLKPYGYDMLITDGFMAMWNDPNVCPDGYMTHYGSVSLKEIIAMCEDKGLRLGVYDNPLWKHCADNIPIRGTSATWGSLMYNSAIDNVRFPGKGDVFSWIVPAHKGAEECIEGFFRYYASIGVHYVRMDFLCLFEDGTGAGDMPGRGYGRAQYEQALQWIQKYAQKYGVFTSLVMPHLYDYARLEAQYGDMIRIDADTFTGGWGHLSAWNRGGVAPSWPNCHNAFDGYVHWSPLTGKGNIILDGDFIRLNVYDNDDERMSEISLHVMAGGPLSCADQPSTIGGYLHFYQNRNLISLVKERFIGKPLGDPNNLWDVKNQIWWGACENGDYVIGLFNREDQTERRAVDFEKDLGLDGLWQKVDQWTNVDEGIGNEYSAQVSAHGCRIIRISKINQ